MQERGARLWVRGPAGETAMDPVDAAEFDRVVEGARERLSAPAFAAAWAAGRALSLDQAVEESMVLG